MREIKFRAWDNEEKRYLKPIDTTSMVLRFISGRVTDGAVNCPHIELQQYTGLKDKNGLEIYEGDIIEFTYTSGMTEIKSISYLDGMFIFDDKYRNSIRHNNTSCEVIGNIYENPELLVSTDTKGD